MPQEETRRGEPTALPPVSEQAQSEDWPRLILSNTSDLISTHAPDATFAFVSGACRRVLGYEPEELLGSPVFEIIHPDDLPEARQVNQRLRGSSEVQTFTFRVRRKDGSYVWIEGTVRVLTRPDGDYQVAVMRDVTVTKMDRDRQEQLLRELERAAFEWRSTFDAIQWPLLILGLDGRLRRINRAGMELLSRHYRDLIGLPVARLGSGQPWEAVAALTQRVLENFSPEVCEARDETRAKTWEVEASVAAGSGADDAQVIVQVREITETIRLQESLRHSETMAVLGAVVGGVAHEVRNPLFGMSSVLDAFESRFGDRTEYRTYLPMLRTELGRMTDLMQALLDYGKPTRFDMIQGNVAEAMESALNLCRGLAERQGVTLTQEVAPGGFMVLFDRARLAQAFKNVVENAVQHSPPGGEVRISAGPADADRAWVRVAVNDSGPGFNPADLGQALEPFFSRRKGGTGLGLSIVSRIVEGHGGRLRIANRPHGGAVVEIELPCLRPAEAL